MYSRIFCFLWLLLGYIADLQGQLANGSSAYEISGTTINNTGYSLTAAMAGGKSACIDFMATWCGPCWSFHSSNVLKDVYNNLSAYTTVVMIEGDQATNLNCLYGPSGCTGRGTYGNWVAGTPYPIINVTSTNAPSVMNDYNVNYFPTLYVISPDFRVWEIQNRSYSEYYSWIVNSFSLNATAQYGHSPCGDNGFIDLQPTGGQAPLTYKWSNGSTTQDLNNIPGGTYEVTVTDNNGYFEEYGPWTINGPAKRVGITSQSVKNNDCFGFQKGRISVQIAFGTPPYQYNWTNGGQTNEINNLPAGPYSLTVTDDVGCTITKSFLITEPAELLADLRLGMETCDSKNGFLAVTARGGTKPYYYDIGAGKKTNSFFDKLKEGTYKLNLTDSKNCFFIQEFMIDATHKPKTEAGADQDLICTRDTIFLEGFGTETGTDFIYSWTTKAGKIIGDDKTLQIRAVKDGTYFLWVKNLINGCENTDSVKIYDKRILPDVQVSSDSLINCDVPELLIQGSTNTIKDTRYYWTKLNSNFKDTSSHILIQEGGSYVFNVLDTLTHCLSKDTVIISADLTFPNVEIAPSGELSCNIKTLILDASGSDAGPDFIPQWLSSNGNFLSGKDGYQPLIDQPGVYVFQLKNKRNGCQTTEALTINENKSLPVFEISDPGQITCLHPEILVGPDNPSAELDYQWTTQNGLILGPSNRAVIRIAKAGDYQMSYTHKVNGCNDQKSLTVSEQSTPVSDFTSVADQLEVQFSDRSKGNPTLRKWSFGDTQFSSETNPLHRYAQSGRYEVCLEISNDCGTHQSCQILDLGVNNKDLSLTSWEIAHVSCFDGTNGRIKVNADGGLPPYTFKWSHGPVSNEIIDLSAGKYTVEISDQSGQKLDKTYEIRQPELIQMQNVQLKHISSAALGSINYDVIGGIPPYRYFWSNGETIQSPQDLKAGSYSLTITDANSCSREFGPFELIDVSSSRDLVQQQLLKMYPNPARSVMYLELNAHIPQQVLFLQITGSDGQLVRSVKYNSRKFEVNLSDIPSGLYLIRLQGDKNLSITEKLIILD